MGKNNGLNIKSTALIVVAVFFVLLLAIVVSMNIRNVQEQQAIIEESIESQLLSISVAAREILDVDAFVGYNSQADADTDAAHYDETLAELRQLADNVGAEYIYALKELRPGYYIFVFDTDTEDPTVFIEYEISDVHLAAFNGEARADVMNVVDEYGSFNTGAVPIWKDGEVVGVIATDTQDTYLEQSRRSARIGTITLISVLVLVMGAMFSVVALLTSRVRQMQRHLEHLAHHDSVTGLPNRQFLMEYLEQITGEDRNEPFALFFIDLDNFKAVNDNAGHDAGDESLRLIAQFLQQNDGNKSFRPSAGTLGLSARIGGDEFVQIVPGITTQDEAETYAQDLLDSFANTVFNQHVRDNHVGLSIGVAFYPEQSRNYNLLIKMADTAMYFSKKDGKNRSRIYDQAMGINLHD